MGRMGPTSLTELWALIKAGFARKSHTHTASDLPTATNSSAGIVRPDGVTTTVVNGQIVAQAQDSSIPLGTVLWSTSSANPGANGMAGTWTLRTRAFLTLSGDSTCFYLWEKTAQASGDSVLPIGAVIYSVSGINPADQGHVGTWTLRGQVYIPFTDSTTYYLYERTA